MARIIITPQQCRAARELLGWNQEVLSQISEVSQSTISNFERNESEREIKVGTLIDIVDSFEEAGIRFTDDQDRYGVWLEYDYEDLSDYDEDLEDELDDDLDDDLDEDFEYIDEE